MSNVVAVKVEQWGEAELVQAAMPVKALAGDALQARVREQLAARQISQAAAAVEIGRSDGALSSWLNGRYKGDIPALEAQIKRWLRQQEARREAVHAMPKVAAWIATPSAEKVQSALRHAHSHGDIALVHGGAGLGKTTTVRHYQAQRNNVWVATMTPAHAGLVSSLKGIAEAVGVEASGGAEPMFRAILHKVRKTGGLLVIEEAQHLTVPALEQIRAINDACELGIAFVGNERVYARMAGSAQAEFLAQLRSRIGKRVRLVKPLPGDVKALAGAWGVSGCEADLQEIAGRPGALRGVVKVLKLACTAASKQGRVPSREDVRTAWRELGGVA